VAFIAYGRPCLSPAWGMIKPNPFSSFQVVIFPFSENPQMLWTVLL
jgi:hypothetical protein